MCYIREKFVWGAELFRLYNFINKKYLKFLVRMITENQGVRRGYRIFLDILSVLVILTIINVFLGFFSITIPLIGKIIIGPVWGLIFLINVFKFSKLTKKYKYIFLSSLIIIGPILKVIAFSMFLDELAKTGGLIEALQGIVPTSLNLPAGFYILNYGGGILLLLGLISMLTFYLKYHRKYLSRELSLQELGVQEATNEQQFTQQWQEKEQKQNKVGWIIIIILAAILAGVFIYMALM